MIKIKELGIFGNRLVNSFNKPSSTNNSVSSDTVKPKELTEKEKEYNKVRELIITANNTYTSRKKRRKHVLEELNSTENVDFGNALKPQLIYSHNVNLEDLFYDTVIDAKDIVYFIKKRPDLFNLENISLNKVNRWGSKLKEDFEDYESEQRRYSRFDLTSEVDNEIGKGLREENSKEINKDIKEIKRPKFIYKNHWYSNPTIIIPIAASVIIASILGTSVYKNIVKNHQLNQTSIANEQKLDTILSQKQVNFTKYTVKEGDGLGTIAWEHRLENLGGEDSNTPFSNMLYRINKNVIGDNPNLIYPGQTYLIPADSKTYKILKENPSFDNSKEGYLVQVGPELMPVVKSNPYMLPSLEGAKKGNKQEAITPKINGPEPAYLTDEVLRQYSNGKRIDAIVRNVRKANSSLPNFDEVRNSVIRYIKDSMKDVENKDFYRTRFYLSEAKEIGLTSKIEGMIDNNKSFKEIRKNLDVLGFSFSEYAYKKIVSQKEILAAKVPSSLEDDYKKIVSQKENVDTEFLAA